MIYETLTRLILTAAERDVNVKSHPKQVMSTGDSLRQQHENDGLGLFWVCKLPQQKPKHCVLHCTCLVCNSHVLTSSKNSKKHT